MSNESLRVATSRKRRGHSRGQGFAAIAVMLVGIALAWQSTLIWAAATATNRNAGANVQGFVSSANGVQDQFNSTLLDSTLTAPNALNLPPESASFGNITVSSRAQESMLFNSSGNVFSVTGNLLATSSTAGQSATAGGTTETNLSAGLGFDVDTLSSYQLRIPTFSLTTDNANTSRSLVRLGLSGPLGDLYSRRFDLDDSEETGSMTGQLVPGHYSIGTNLRTFAQSNLVGGKRAELRYTLDIRRAFRWTDPVSGTFQVADNWTADIEPGGEDVAIVDRPGTYTISLGGNAANHRLDVRGNGTHVTLDLDGHRYRLDELLLGDASGNFSFTLSDSSGIAAAPPGNTGPWPAPGTGEAEFTIVKSVGPGRTDITAETISQTGLIDDGHVVNVGADGDWKVKDLTVGDEEPATLMVFGGGKVNSSFPIIGKRVRGILSSTRGKVTVAGGGGLVGKFDAIEMIVGDDGKGELEIKNGGEVTAAEIHVGKHSNGVGVVTVDGLTAIMRQNHTIGGLLIGSEGKGTFNVRNGGQVHADGFISIGGSTAASSDGNLNVSNGIVRAKHLSVGIHGKGTLSLVGDCVAVADRTVIGPQGKVTVADDGALRANIVLTVNGELQVNTTGSAIVSGAIGPIPLGKLTVGPGGTLKGNGTIRADLNLAGGTPNFTGSRAAPANSTGTLTIEGDVVQEAGSAMEIEIGGTTAGLFDVLKVTGNATLGGDVFLKFTDGFAPRQGQQFEFLDVSGTLSGSFANVELRNLAPGFQFDLRRDGGGMTMVALNDGVFMLPPSSAWNVDASGNWSSVSNWTAGDPNHAGGTAVFGNKITSPRTVAVDAPVKVGRIDFENAHAYTITGDSAITLDATNGDAQINVTSGNHTISAPVSLADNTVITVSPAASNLSITGALSASDVNLTKAGPGRLTLANIQAAGLSIDAGTVAMAPNGTPDGASAIGALTIAGGATPTAKLDLNNNAAIINYTGTSPAATVRGQILAGRGGQGLGAAWNGQGITSSAAATANATDAESRSVGYAENSALPLGPYTTFRGQPVDDTSLLMAFTITGDANLDGLVNDDDVTIVGATYAPGVPQPQWALGDFDYNGFVDDDDVTLLGVFYNPSAPPLAVSPPVGANQVNAVPEPSAILLFVFGTLALAMSRKRRTLCSLDQ